MARVWAICALLLANVLAATMPVTHELHEKRGTLHPRWTKRDRVASHKLLPIHIGLASGIDDERAEAHLMDVSDPASPNFAKHWTAEEVVEVFRPADDTVHAVHKWLTDSAIHPDRITHSDNRGWFAFYATSAEAEALLHTKFYEYHDSQTGQKIPSCDQYHLPKHLRHHIDYVTPGVKLLAAESGRGALKKRTVALNPAHVDLLTDLSSEPDLKADSASIGKNLPPSLRNCDKKMTPDCIAALYGIPPTNHHDKPNPENSMGIYKSYYKLYEQENLDLFFKGYAPYIPQGTKPAHYLKIDGAPGPTTNQSEDGGEAELDMQISFPIVYPQTITIFMEDDTPYEKELNDSYTFGFNTWFDAIDGSYCTFSAYGETGDSPIDPQYPDPRPGGYKGKLQCGIYKPTTVMSLSYGGQEADLPVSYQKCLEFLKLGLQGSSIFIGSGDAGVGNDPGVFGTDNVTTGCLGPKGQIFNREST